MKDPENFWNGVAPKYAKSPIKDEASYHYTLERTRAYLNKGDRVLEIGAGTGSTALLLADSVSEIVATDLADVMLDVGRARAKEQGVENVSFHRCDVLNPPEGPFDVVLAHNILHLVEDLPGALAAAYAALRPGGLMISKTVCRPEKGLNLEMRVMFLILPLMQMIGKAPFVALRSFSDFDAAVWNAGFERVEAMTYPAKGVSRYVVARKAA